MRHLGALSGKRLVMERLRRFRIERERELITPTELEARLAHRIVPDARRGVPLGEIGGVRGDAIGDDACLHVVAVGKSEMLLRRDVAEHRRSEEHTSELQSQFHLVCRLLLEKKKK